RSRGHRNRVLARKSGCVRLARDCQTLASRLGCRRRLAAEEAPRKARVDVRSALTHRYRRFVFAEQYVSRCFSIRKNVADHSDRYRPLEGIRIFSGPPGKNGREEGGPMSVSRSAGAIFWGLTLVAIGGLLLAYNLGYPIHIWPYIVRYWPALLIGWGLLKVVDYFRFRRSGDNRPLFSGGEVALLIFVIFAGSAITTAANVSPELGRIFEIGDIDLWDITGNNYVYDQHIERQNVKPASDIEIVNFFGDVEVRPADSDRIVLDVKKTIRAGDKQEADRLEREFTFSIEDEGSRYRIVSNRDQSGFHGTPRQRFKSSLTVQVPKHSSLRLDNRNGRVLVQDLTGNQNILNRYGDVDVRMITGKVALENRNGGVTVEDVSE